MTREQMRTGGEERGDGEKEAGLRGPSPTEWTAQQASGQAWERSMENEYNWGSSAYLARFPYSPGSHTWKPSHFF